MLAATCVLALARPTLISSVGYAIAWRDLGSAWVHDDDLHLHWGSDPFGALPAAP